MSPAQFPSAGVRSVLVLVTVLAAAGSSLVARPASASTPDDHRFGGSRLVAGDRLVSEGGGFTVTVQSDGNVVERRVATGAALWSTGTAGHPGAALDVQTDGNLVVRTSAGRALWVSGTAGYPRSRVTLVLESSGTLSLSDAGRLWRNGVGVSPARTSLGPGESIRPTDVDNHVIAPSGDRVRLRVGNDAIVLSEAAIREAPLWIRRTSHGGAVLTMQTDGNLVLRSNDGVAAWSSGTRGTGNRLTVQDDGNVVIRRPNGAAVWSTGTTRVLLMTGETAASGARFVAGGSLYPPGTVTTVQSDGNVVTRTAAGRLVWTTRTFGNPGARLVVQRNGDLVVVRPDGRAVWRSGTGGCGSLSVFDAALGAISVGDTAVWTAGRGRTGAC